MERTPSDVARITREIELNEAEHAPERVAEYKPPSTLVLHEALRSAGEEQIERHPLSTMWSGIVGGLSMGLSLLGAGFLHAHLPDTKWRILLTSIGFTLGFVAVIGGRQGLITEIAVSGVLPLLDAPSAKTARKVARAWATVLVANVIAIALFAWACMRTEIFSQDVRNAFVALGHEAIAASFGTQLARAVAAGWIIGLAAWVAPVFRAGQVFAIPLLLWVIGVGHFGHIISGSAEVLCATFAGEVSFGAYVTRFFVPVVLGNLFGAAVLVAALNHAGVARRRALLARRSADAAHGPLRAPAARLG